MGEVSDVGLVIKPVHDNPCALDVGFVYGHDFTKPIVISCQGAIQLLNIWMSNVRADRDGREAL